MGYTHYWSIKKDISQPHWEKFCEVCKVLIENAPQYSESSGGYYSDVPLYVHGELQRNPIIDKDEICFNGGDVPPEKRKKNTYAPHKGEPFVYYGPKRAKNNSTYAHDEYSHETFLFTRVIGDDTFMFCKTARKPYDLLVQACLIAAVALLPEVERVSSDGNLDEWKAALEYVASHFPDITIKVAMSPKFQV